MPVTSDQVVLYNVQITNNVSSQVSEQTHAHGYEQVSEHTYVALQSQVSEQLSENLHSEMHLNELDSPQNFLTMYDMSNNINEHGFASHLGYTPTYRFYLCVNIRMWTTQKH